MCEIYANGVRMVCENCNKSLLALIPGRATDVFMHSRLYHSRVPIGIQATKSLTVSVPWSLSIIFGGTNICVRKLCDWYENGVRKLKGATVPPSCPPLLPTRFQPQSNRANHRQTDRQTVRQDKPNFWYAKSMRTVCGWYAEIVMSPWVLGGCPLYS